MAPFFFLNASTSSMVDLPAPLGPIKAVIVPGKNANTLKVQSESREPILKIMLVLIISIFIISMLLFKNLFFKSTYLLKSFGELSVDPEIAFTNNKPTFLEFYAEWCEVCKEMAPKVSAFKDEYEKDINFVFLNVDNQKWGNYIQKFAVNGIPQVNLFDKKGNLISTFIGKQDEIKIRESINNLKNEKKPYEEIINAEFSTIQENKKNVVNPRSHG